LDLRGRKQQGDWRELHGEELHDLYSTPDIMCDQIKKDEMDMACRKRNVYKVFVGKPEEKRLLVRPRHRWKGNIKMDLKEMG
jgi:hypothetical protein